ncbi:MULTISPECIES: MFS transporter [unclassified Pseudomonas]|jgi:Arabinose efflux permease|uniref:MFS transporter n=1 Tax=unclassified Pseudomonas TaxID=196821 RepID=UPI000406BE31|nr:MULTISPECIES: MFS transporter [unclassified Pseudomonas]SMF30903.1 Predicted arabinose efflux permease, MFS family [Pseudomonas sp. LAIL14HWK12:I11]SMR78150.1 Predicted arabinose efflux permease, MFS family [Pseudomonas sp. LAIL14HWK12:I10]SOD04448.1 Predicted arabinose efflux permease, MFS family [Pseudomonas sp. LAIL14HWK12:I8]
MSQTSSAPLLGDSAERLPLSGLLALAMTGFIAILSETLPAGLLDQIAGGMTISQAMAGQWVTAYALGSLLTAIPLVTLTQGWYRRRALLLAIGGFVLFNGLTALSSSNALTLVLRFFTGAAAGLAWGLIAGHARRMVPVALQGRAMAVAMLGQPIALSLGLPIGTWLGALLGWRATFVVVTVVALLLVVWVLRAVPDYPGQAAGKRPAALQVLRTPGVALVLLVIMTWILGHNILYTYIVPLLGAAGMAAEIGQVLMVFGLSALAGIGLVGLLVDRHLRTLVLLSLAGFAVATLVLGQASSWALYLSIALWGVTYGGAPTLLQTACADAAGEGGDVAQSMLVTVWNSAIALGGIIGGLLLTGAGVAWFGPVALVLIGLAWLLAWAGRRGGFKAGSR